MILPATFGMCFCILAQLWRDSQVTKGIQRMLGRPTPCPAKVWLSETDWLYGRGIVTVNVVLGFASTRPTLFRHRNRHVVGSEHAEVGTFTDSIASRVVFGVRPSDMDAMFVAAPLTHSLGSFTVSFAVTTRFVVESSSDSQ
jgi:hypothetical protein